MLLALFGCYVSPNKKVEFYPTDYMMTISPDEESWYILTCKDSEDVSCNKIIVLRLYGRGIWFIKNNNNVDVWKYNIKERARESVLSKKREENYRWLQTIREYSMEKDKSLISTKISPALSIFDYEVAYNSCVELNLDKIFTENSWCNMIWVDDGLKGLAYERDKGYVGFKTLREMPMRDFADVYKVSLRANSYDDLYNLSEILRR